MTKEEARLLLNLAYDFIAYEFDENWVCEVISKLNNLISRCVDEEYKREAEELLKLIDATCIEMKYFGC